jgi:hypothetical protein
MDFRPRQINMANLHVVFVGNSLTAPGGVGSPTWADYLSNRLTTAGATFRNFGVNGQTTDAILGNQYYEADASFVTGKTNILFFSEVTNGLANGFSLVSEQNRVKTYSLNRKARGFKVFNLTCFDRIQGGNPDIRNNVLLYNTWLRANFTSFSDGLIECWRIPALGNANTFVDSVHPSGQPLIDLADMAFNTISRYSR